MLQNQSMKKISSFIGITLLITIIIFTVFINFFVKEPIEEIEEDKIKIVKITDPQYSILDSTDLVNLWKLRKLHTDSVKISHNKERTSIQISEFKTSSDYNLLRESGVYDEFDDSIKQLIEITYFEEEKITYCGTLDFKNLYDANNTITFENVEIKKQNSNSCDSTKLIEIGKLFLKYQIKSIQTKPQIGDFTTIYLRDGRELFLIKENIVLNGDYYKERIKRAKYLNDSTRVIYPY